MITRFRGPSRTMPRLVLTSLVAAMLVGCGSSATQTPVPTSAPTAVPPTASAPPTAEPSVAPPPTAAPSPQPTESAAPQPQVGGVLTMAWSEEPQSFNPIGPMNNGSIFTIVQMFDQLVELKPGTKDVVPGLAESWEVSPDGMSYTFHIRDAKFSNGDPVTIDDVKFSVDRFINPEVNVNYSFLVQNAKDAEIVDPKTIRINMKSVDASFLQTLTEFFASIVPKKVVESLGEEAFGENPVGTGPFMLKSWTRGQKAEMVRNPSYWRPGQPYLDGVTFLFIKDDITRILKLQSGEAQAAVPIPVSQVQALGNIAGLKVLIEPALTQYHVYLNNAAKPLDDKLVRQALNYATPKEIINELAFAGVARVANTMTTATLFWDESVPPYAYDIDKAKELMAQSSAPDGFPLPLLIVAGDVGVQQTATILQAEWAKIGVKVEILPLDQAAVEAKRGSKDFMANLFPANLVSSDVFDDNLMTSIFLDYTSCCESVWTSYNSPEVTKLIRDANSTLDPAKRQEMYSQVQKTTMEDAPFVSLLLPPHRSAVRDTVQGFATLPTGWWLLQDVWLSQ